MIETVIDERQLPAMYMVWPIDRLLTAPEIVLSSE
jgi:hypothetical protein